MTRYCANCGAPLAEGASFCANCGAPAPGAVRAPATGPTNGKAVASLVCGIGGLVLLPLVLSILALVFGYQARREIEERGESGSGLATAGIVLGWVGIAVFVIGILFFITTIAVFSTHSTP